MANSLSRTDVVEKELAQLQNGIRESLGILASLNDIKQQFTGIVTTYNEAQVLLKRANNHVAELEKKAQTLRDEFEAKVDSYEERFVALEAANADKWQSIQEQIVETHDALQTSNKNLRIELGHKITELQGDVEKRLESYSERLENLKGILSNEMETQLQKFAEILDAKLEEVDSRTSSAVATVTDRLTYIIESQGRTKWRIRTVRILAIVALVIAALAAYPLISPYLASFF